MKGCYPDTDKYLQKFTMNIKTGQLWGEKIKQGLGRCFIFDIWLKMVLIVYNTYDDSNVCHTKVCNWSIVTGFKIYTN